MTISHIAHFRDNIKTLQLKFSPPKNHTRKMDLILLIAIIAIILSILYYYLTCNYNYWQNQGIPHAKNIIPGFGNILPVLLQRQSFPGMCEKWYNKHKHSMFGLYQMRTPTLLVRDPELVKTVLLTNFANFGNNQFEVTNSKFDRIFAINPFFSKVDTWKENRAPLTSAFSSKKLKLMLPSINDVGKNLEIYLKRKIALHHENFELELKHFSNMFTGEIAAAAIGFQGHNFQDETESTKGRWAYKRFIERFFSEPFFTGGIQQVIFLFLPRLANFFHLTMIPEYVYKFFHDTLKNILSYRKNENLRSSDFLQIMVDYFKANGMSVNDNNETLISHIVTFAIEIYETSAITLSFLLFQLAAHHEIQEKVRGEVKKFVEKSNGKLEYDDFREMTYLEQVLNESMRLNHVIGTMMKVCTKETQLIGSDGLTCTMKPGNVAVISTYGLQMDPNHWPNPEKFDPDRFSDEQKAGRHKFTFIPFGEGPRICVGLRLATIIIKMVVAIILKDYHIQVSPKTPLPLKKDEASFMTAFEEGLHVIIKPLK